MNEPLENLYFNWLCAKVMPTRLEGAQTPSQTYYRLLGILHNTEFVWLMSGDDNRAEDGLELRREFILAGDFPDDPEWRSYGCSLLEMFIAISRRAESMSMELEPAFNWFWEFMENLGLKEFPDATGVQPEDLEECLAQFIWRTYDVNGRGGMFPIENPIRDQTRIQLWYQLCDYLNAQSR